MGALYASVGALDSAAVGLPLVLMMSMCLPLNTAVYSGPLQPEISNGTFHHFFVPDGDYEEYDDPEKCQMLFKFSDARRCDANEDGDSVVRDDFIIAKLLVEDTARLLENIVRTISYDLEGDEGYGKYLRREISQIGEAFAGVDTSLSELEVKFKQSQESDLKEEHQLNGSVVKPLNDVKGTIRETKDISVGLKDKQELLSLVVRSHGTRLSRLKTAYLNV
ncbi:hypothetical protein NHX12_002312 [Muraenolepis orangiensis]|uniref:Fin bud initiation factor a n=1 Tax=Muraenolepis orangiensis TaxID=630683 RepID=A0A9Q0IF58_9TELE|nr:hypothetical protein NHX12_002312 [Muraenolepis orangiensis]